MSSNNIRRVKTSVENLYLEKQKLEKGDKPKKNKGGKIKGKLRVEHDVSFSALFPRILSNFSHHFQDDYSTQANKYSYDDEYDDFM